MILLTVGSTLPFDRLIELVDQAVGMRIFEEEVFAQIGQGEYKPRNMEFVEYLPKQSYDRTLGSAKAVISHAGIGTITACLSMRKQLLVMPRQHEFGELVDNHQQKTARMFASLGHVLSFESLAELEDCVRQLRSFTPAPRDPNRLGISKEISRFLQEICPLADRQARPDAPL